MRNHTCSSSTSLWLMSALNIGKTSVLFKWVETFNRSNEPLVAFILRCILQAFDVTSYYTPQNLIRYPNFPASWLFRMWWNFIVKAPTCTCLRIPVNYFLSLEENTIPSISTSEILSLSPSKSGLHPFYMHKLASQHQSSLTIKTIICNNQELIYIYYRSIWHSTEKQHRSSGALPPVFMYINMYGIWHNDW